MKKNHNTKGVKRTPKTQIDNGHTKYIQSVPKAINNTEIQTASSTATHWWPQ